MATYFKYAERSADSQVNWAEIGKNLTDTLQEENRIREEKKAAIDEATRQYGLTLEKSPQGDDTSLNQWSLDFAAQAQEARLLQDRLLKSGQLKLKDYTKMRQNLTDGTNTAFSLLDEYNAEYKEKMERAKSMDPATASQYLEQWLLAQGESFANFKQSQLYINPTTFEVNIALKEQDDNGVYTMSHNPNKFTSVNALRNRIKARYDKFDSNAFLTSRVAMLGDEIRAYKTAAEQLKAGTIGTEENIRVRDGFLQAQAAFINEGLVLPENVSSILTNDLGYYTDANGDRKKFDFSWETPPTKNRDPSIIYLKNDNGHVVIDISEDQKKIAQDFLTQKMDMMLDFKQTISTYNNPQKQNKTAAEIDEENRRKDLKDGYYYWNLVRSGTDAEKQAAVKWLNGSSFLKRKNIDSIGLSDDGKALVINYGSTIQNIDGVESGSPANFQTIRLYDANENVLAGENWMAQAAEVFGTISPQDAKNFAKGEFRQAENPTKIRVGKNIGYDPNVKTEGTPATGTGTGTGGGGGGGASQFNEEG